MEIAGAIGGGIRVVSKTDPSRTATNIPVRMMAIKTY